MKARILNLGSINIDHVYRVDHFVQPGETLASDSLSVVLGGKGANQSFAIVCAGGEVKHLGRVNEADHWVFSYLINNGIDTSLIEPVDVATGHAIIQVDSHGENCILLHGGANQSFEPNKLQAIISQYEAGDYLLMQNETNAIDFAFELAIKQGMKVVLNPAPMSDAIHDLPLEELDTLIVNFGEAQSLSKQTALDDVSDELLEMLPNTRIVITLGAQGAILLNNGSLTRVAAKPAEVVDTTGAGDTFVGYFLSAIVDGLSDFDALDRACHAAALAVETAGAMPSIPKLGQLMTTRSIQ